MNENVGDMDEITDLMGQKKSRKQVLTKEQLNLIYRQISMRIREERTARKISYTKIYELTGITTGHIHKIESGKCNIGLASLIRIAICFDMQIAEFIPFLGSLGSQKKEKEKQLSRILSGLDENELEAISNMVQAFVQFRQKGA